MARSLLDGQVGESDEGFEANQMSLGMLVPLADGSTSCCG
jgi:hypothetical protein